MGDGKNLKKYLDEKGTNVRKIAKATGIIATTLYSIIQKDSNIRFDFALRLANELQIDVNKSVYQVISGGNELIRMGGRDINARAYLSRFNFSGGDQEKLCGVLIIWERQLPQDALLCKLHSLYLARFI